MFKGLSEPTQNAKCLQRKMNRYSLISLSLRDRKEKKGSLDSLCEDVHSTYEKLIRVRTPDQELIRKVDTCDAQTKAFATNFTYSQTLQRCNSVMMKIIGQFEVQCLEGQELAKGLRGHPPSSV